MLRVHTMLLCIWFPSESGFLTLNLLSLGVSKKILCRNLAQLFTLLNVQLEIGQRIDQAKSTSEDGRGEEGKASLDSTCLLHQPRSMHVQGTSIDPCCCRMMSEMGMEGAIDWLRRKWDWPCSTRGRGGGSWMRCIYEGKNI